MPGSAADCKLFRDFLRGLLEDPIENGFQGLAILEGMALGCLPLVPDRLAYPEYVAREFRYRSTPDNLLAECEQVVSRLENYQRQLSKGHLPRAKLPPEFADSQLVSAYVEVINRLLAHGGMTVAGDNI